MWRTAGLARTVIFATGCVAGWTPPAAPARHQDLALHTETFALANGIRVVVVTDPSATDVQLTARYAVGAADDPADAHGLAHLVEHLLYDEARDGRFAFDRFAAVTSYFNGFTSLDSTTYVARAQQSEVDRLLDLEAERLSTRCASVPDEQFARERQVVLAELQQRSRADEPATAVANALFPASHAYHAHTSESVADVAKLTRARACAFADEHYVPENLVLVISGRLDRTHVEPVIAQRFAGIARRAVPPRVEPAPLTSRVNTELTTSVSIDTLVLAWAVPADPEQEARTRAVLTNAASAIEREGDCSLRFVELGDERQRFVAIVMTPLHGSTISHVIDGADRVLSELPRAFDKDHDPQHLALARLRDSALYRFYASIEDANVRDPWLAHLVADGRDPERVIHADVGVIAALTNPDAAEAERHALAYDRAHAFVLHPGPRSSVSVAVAAPGPDMHEPMHLPAQPTAINVAKQARPETYALANGLRVVIDPIASAPIVDIRLVFGAGTDDDANPDAGRLAAMNLDWDHRYLADLVAFVRAGGAAAAGAYSDHTTFGVHGLAGRFDYLLAGLRRWVREGRLDDGRASAFRTSHFTPDHATLVIAGRVDSALAHHWVDYLFGDWTGHEGPRAAPQDSPGSAALAHAEPGAQVRMSATWQALHGSRAARVVATEMLSELASDARMRLGATYGLDVRMAEHRASTSYTLTGAVAAASSADVMRALAASLADARANGAASELFATARARVLVRIAAQPSDATTAAEELEHEVALGLEPDGGAELAGEIAGLTLDRVREALADLDPGRARIEMWGPAPEMAAAFAAFGRADPTDVPHASTAAVDAPAPSPFGTFHGFEPKERFDPITSPKARLHGRYTATAGWATTTIDIPKSPGLECSCSGGSVGLDAGVTLRGPASAGVHVAGSDLLGTTALDNKTESHRFLTAELGAFAQTRLSGPFWAGGRLGVHFEREHELGATSMLGAQLGLDAVRLAGGWIGLFVEGDLLGTQGAVSLGLAFHH